MPPPREKYLVEERVLVFTEAWMAPFWAQRMKRHQFDFPFLCSKGVHRFFDMPDFISFVSYHPSGCILRKIYKYQGISSVWLKNAQTLNRHAWRLLQRRVAEPLEQKVFLPKRRQKPWSTPRPLRNKAVQPRAVRIGRIFYDFMIPPLRPLDLSP